MEMVSKAITRLSKRKRERIKKKERKRTVIIMSAMSSGKRNGKGPGNQRKKKVRPPKMYF